MSRYIIIILFMGFLLNGNLYPQNRYIVQKAAFSTGLNDEFSPVYYGSGYVFCSNTRDKSLISYRNEEERLFKIMFVDKKEGAGWKQPQLLSKELSTDFNDGPVTFNADGNLIYYSRNNSIERSLRNISDTTNKLGIYSAELIDGKWSRIKAFSHNNPQYSYCTPSLTADGKRLYFSSDMPGGYGGMDLYYCDWRNEDWSAPVNMGKLINTSNNESFPFACIDGKLFFASDGHESYGGKDIYFTAQMDGSWIDPIHLSPDINSKADDFGLVTDPKFEKGFFSTNRLKSDDIFSFSLVPVEFTRCDTVVENNYCFTFYDEQQSLIDSIPATYTWDFGSGIKRTGREVKHCFTGPGKYTVSLQIVDKVTGNVIVEKVDYNVELEDVRQAYINSNNVGVVDQPVSFDALRTNIEDFEIKDYLWNFGDGFEPGGPVSGRVFQRKGEYTLQLGLMSVEDSLGNIPPKCFTKKIRIFDSYDEVNLQVGKGTEIKKQIAAGGNDKLQLNIYFMDDLSEKQRTIIQTKINITENSTLNFDTYGIEPSSYPLLDKIAQLLESNKEIRLEMAAYDFDGKAGISGNWIQQLAFYFRNKDVSPDSFHYCGYGSTGSMFKKEMPDIKSANGIIEFIFMKN